MSANRSKPRKEALFVRVVAPDESVEFHDVTEHIGQSMPFTNPRATLAMRVSDAAVTFSLLHLTKRAAAGLVTKPVEFPRGPIARLERRIADLTKDLEPGKVIVEINDEVHTFTIERDSSGAVELVGDDNGIDLPKSAVQMAMYIQSGAAKRPLGIGFIGHVGKPESSETIRRITSMVLNSMSQLASFRLLTDIETVRVPAAPRSVVRAPRRKDEKAMLEIPMWLFTEGAEANLIASGNVMLEIDLERANPHTGRLLIHYRPGNPELEASFASYKVAVDFAIAQKLRIHFGDDEIKAIATDIELAQVSSGTIERLRDALTTMSVGFDLTPTMHRDHA